MVNELIDSVTDPYVRGRLQALQDVVTELDGEARKLSAELSDLDAAATVGPGEEQVFAKMRATLVEQRLRQVLATGNLIAARFQEEVSSYEKGLSGQ